MTVSCPTWGPIWGSPAMRQSLRELRLLGVEWVAIHPYARLRRDGTIRFQPAAELDFLKRAVEIAREESILLFWKPHLAYWGSFEWRGDIDFGDDERAWHRFFEGYRAFIVDQARFAEASGVPLFSVGTELEGTTGREEPWRRIVTEVDRIYSGQLTYAANWDRLDRVPFWSALDLIGVQAYFPLTDDPSPTRRQLQAGWESHLDRLEELSERHDRPVVFTEIGYDQSLEAARQPWSGRGDGSLEAVALRSSLLEVALERLPKEPWLAGMFWWKWMPGEGPRDRGDRDFSMRAHEARQVLKEYWSPSGQPKSR